MKVFHWMEKLVNGMVLSILLTGMMVGGSSAAQTVPSLANSPAVLSVPVTPGQTEAQISLPVSATDSMRLQIIVPVNDAAFSLLDPAGGVVVQSGDPSVSFLDGATLSPPLPGGVFITPTIDAPADGTWILDFRFPAAQEATVIMATLFTETAYQVGIALEKNEYRVGQLASIGMIALHQGQPLLGLSPSIIITAPSGSSVTLAGMDDGDPAHYDGLADDGIYSVGYTFDEAGVYFIQGEVEISTASGIQTKTSTAVVTVTEPMVALTNVTGDIAQGPDGCIAGVTVHATVDVMQPSTYVVSGKLAGENGKEIESSDSRNVTASGPVVFDLFYSSEEILNGIGSGGRYSVSQLDVLSFQPSGVSLEERTLNVFEFPSISLDDLCMASITIGNSLDVREQLRDGYIGALEFSFPISVAAPGMYQLSFKVTGSQGEDVEIFGFSEYLEQGSNTVTVSVSYDKLQSVDGPFSVESLLVLGGGMSAQESVVGTSGAYSRWQFYPRIDGDLDGDGDVDRADRSLLLQYRGQQAMSPGDRRDLNRDGRIDLRDARQMVGLVCQAGSCPVN